MHEPNKEPAKDTIEKVKVEHAERSVYHVEIDQDGDTYHFLMTGPSEPEYKKFRSEILAAKGSETEQTDLIDEAIKKAALAQIRWPARDAVVALFKHFPAIHHSFRNEIHKAAGTTAEVRAKKL